jgi:FtsH-binding integral membrane protein
MEVKQTNKIDISVQEHVSKVYGIMLQSLLICTIACVLNCLLLSKFLTLVALITSFASIFGLFGSTTEEGKGFYTNLLAASLGFTSSWLVLAAYIIDPLILVYSVLGTLAIFLIFTLMSRYIKDEDTVAIGGFLLSSLFSLVIVGFLMLFFGTSEGAEIVYIVVGLIVFCAYIAYDTKMMYMKFSNPSENHDHYHHAVNIFLDIINIFIKLVDLLLILADKKKKKKN